MYTVGVTLQMAHISPFPPNSWLSPVRHTLTFICSHMRIARARYGQYSSPYAARQLW